MLVPELQVNEIHLTAYLPVSPEMYTRLKEETAKDDDLQQLQDIVLDGWPDDKTDVPSVLRPYWTFRDGISCSDGLMYKTHKLVIPKDRARDILFWTGMSQDIEDQ